MCHKCERLMLVSWFFPLLYFQSHLVAAFEKSLGNMTGRLQSLTMTAEQKVGWEGLKSTRTLNLIQQWNVKSYIKQNSMMWLWSIARFKKTLPVGYVYQSKWMSMLCFWMLSLGEREILYWQIFPSKACDRWSQLAILLLHVFFLINSCFLWLTFIWHLHVLINVYFVWTFLWWLWFSCSVLLNKGLVFY